MSEVFTLIDASHLVAKANIFGKNEIKQPCTLPKMAVDKQARVGCKGGQQYWYGYKQHVSVDMQSGLMKSDGDTR